MSVHRIMGLESEFGILAPNDPNANPVLLSTQAVLAYGHLCQPDRLERMRWDYDVETPLRDARGFDMTRAEADPSQFTADDYGVANVVLPNGARFYVDHAHPEYSTPEVTNPWDAALWDAAGDRIMQLALSQASKLTGQLLTGFKNNSDGKGASYGTHENYQVQRATEFSQFVRYLTPFFVTRCIFAGAGRVGIGQEGERSGFQISSRADFFEAHVGLETTLRRPIINTRDEPHSDPEKFRRLHVIVGDANISQTMTFLKMGTTALVLTMIEEGALPLEIEFVNPVEAMHQVSHDLSLKQPLQVRNGPQLSAIDIQRMYCQAAHTFVAQRGIHDQQTQQVLQLWSEVLDRLATDVMSLSHIIDWVAKLKILQAYKARGHLHWDSAELQVIDLQYADLRHEKGLAYLLQKRGELQTLFSDDEIAKAVVQPPADTRAFFRGRCIETFGQAIAGASWDSVIFDVRQDNPLIRIQTPDVRKGTRNLTEHLFTNQNVDQFLKALQPVQSSAIG